MVGAVVEKVPVAVGRIVSTVNGETVNRLLGLCAVSVTLILQLLYVPFDNVLKVIVLFPEIAAVVTLEHDHE